MFLLLTYLLFRRPASSALRRSPVEFHFQVRRPVFLKNESLMKKAMTASGASRMNKSLPRGIALVVALIPTMGMAMMTPAPAGAQAQLSVAGNDSKADKGGKEDKREGGAANDRAKDSKDSSAVSEEMRQMRQLIERLEARVNQLEAEKSAAMVEPATPATETPVASAPNASTNIRQTGAPPDGDRKALDFFRDTTISGTVDGYYGYNFNRPVGRVNLLRAYDVASNSFSLNQAAVSIERAPNLDAGRRFGARLDLMFGPATETVQGNAASELRPQAFRPIWQAYGTYVAPVGNGLTTDFGKFASSLGYEGNYTKDQINYSRSYLFNFLPYYHLGFRSNYAFNDKFNVTHYLVNGIGQSEDFNGFKSQAILLNIKPTKRVSWNVNYYTGIEARDSIPALNPGFAPLPTQPGLTTDIINPAPRGRTHIIDTYASWNATDKLTLVGQFDYVISRAQTFSAPSRVTGGAAYARYQFTPKVALAGRGEYLSDSGGLFSGVTQALKETTLTFDYKLTEGVLMRGEWRRDFSDRPFFLTGAPGVLKKDQNTATLGLVWWFGKEGGW
jgi:putative OmpL-like beta-barrel porin-2